MVQYAYDIMDRVTNISWRTTSGATIGGFAYGYDALGRITSRSHTLGDPPQPSPMSQVCIASRGKVKKRSAGFLAAKNRRKGRGRVT